MNRIHLWKKEILAHKHLILISILFLIISLMLNYFAGIYTEKSTTVSVPDLILDHIPTLDLDFIFIYGAIILVIVTFAYPLFFKVKELHVVISQVSLLYLVRSFFVILTHLSTPVGALNFTSPHLFAFFDSNTALFFSGHTALPFLGFLMFKNKMIKYFFLVSTFVMAATVLFMHVHYSIDVFAALFIAYGCHKIGEYFFKKSD